MKLCKDINLGTLLALPTSSSGWRATLQDQLWMLVEAGYKGAQSWTGFGEIRRAGLVPLGMARATEPTELDDIARRHRDEGVAFTNLHLGTGFEDDAHTDALVAALLDAQARHGHVLLVETHRATATQDIWRTLRLIERFPELRFTGDFSHWYTGHELTYNGEFEERSARLEPVFERVRALHGRIGNTGCMQTPLGQPGPYRAHFESLWTRACAGFLRNASETEVLSFAVELLPMSVGTPPFWLNYAQPVRSLLAGDGVSSWFEDGDRFADAQALWDIAQKCFAAARTLQRSTNDQYVNHTPSLVAGG